MSESPCVFPSACLLWRRRERPLERRFPNPIRCLRSRESSRFKVAPGTWCRPELPQTRETNDGTRLPDWNVYASAEFRNGIELLIEAGGVTKYGVACLLDL